jgi:hypothetical protein
MTKTTNATNQNPFRDCFQERSELIAAEAATTSDVIWGVLADRRYEVEDECLAHPAMTTEQLIMQIAICLRRGESMPLGDLRQALHGVVAQ